MTPWMRRELSRALWQAYKKPLGIIGIIAACIGVVVLIFVELRLYGTGFEKKTLWDWLQLLIIPVVLVVGGFLLNNTTSRTEREIASDRQQEEALQAYIDSMSELLLDRKLRESKLEDEVRTIARVRTLTVLPRLDGKRKARVLQCLYESGLIHKDKKIIDLSGADLSDANLTRDKLSDADLSGARLVRANLIGAWLNGADLNTANLASAILRGVDLAGANLRQAFLYKADLSDANLKGADLWRATLYEANFEGVDLTFVSVTSEQLAEAKSLKGARMRDGTPHA